MRIIDVIDIDTAITVLRVLAAVLTGAALLCWARMAPRLLAACLSTALAAMIVAINSGWMIHLDTTAERWAHVHRTPAALAGWSEFWAYVGDPIYFAAAVLACGAWFSWQARSMIPVAVMVAAAGIAVVLEHTLKAAVTRTSAAVVAGQDRPLAPGFIPYLHSFPSGHVAVIGAFIGTTAVCLCAGRRLATKVEVGVVAVALVVFLGALAVYIQAHTFTDVIGGAILGATIVAIAGPSLAAAVARPQPVRSRVVAPARVTVAPAPRRQPVRVG